MAKIGGIGKVGKFLGRGIKNYAINTAIGYGAAYGITKLLQNETVKGKIDEYVSSKLGIGIDTSTIIDTSKINNPDPNKLMKGFDPTDAGNLVINHKKLKDLGLNNINNFAKSDFSSITKGIENKSKSGIKNVTSKLQSETSNISKAISSNDIKTDFNKLVGNIQDKDLSSVYDSLGEYYNDKKTNIVEKATDTKESIVNKASKIDVDNFKDKINEKAKSGDLDIKKIATDLFNAAKERANTYNPENIKKEIDMIQNPEKMVNEMMSEVNSENPLKDFDIEKVQNDIEKEILSDDVIKEINNIGGFNFNG